jgi:hypothetical protein
LGIKFEGCHCLPGRQDNIVKDGYAEMKQTKPMEPLARMGKSLPILA